jgi:hypothetical protein
MSLILGSEGFLSGLAGLHGRGHHDRLRADIGGGARPVTMTAYFHCSLLRKELCFPFCGSFIVDFLKEDVGDCDRCAGLDPQVSLRI